MSSSSGDMWRAAGASSSEAKMLKKIMEFVLLKKLWNRTR